MLIHGEDGVVTLAGRQVARLSRFRFDYDPAGIDFDATATGINEYWLSRGGPFVVSLTLGKERMTWRDAAVSRAGDGLHITAQGRPKVHGAK